EVAMAHGRPAVGVLHRLVSASSPVRLELTPLCTWRSVHGERFAGGDPAIEAVDAGFVFGGSFRVAGGAWEPGGSWDRGVRGREEAARGLNDVEDVWAAGSFAATLAPGDVHQLTAAAAPFAGTLPSASEVVQAARVRARELVGRAGAVDAIDAQ